MKIFTLLCLTFICLFLSPTFAFSEDNESMNCLELTPEELRCEPWIQNALAAYNPPAFCFSDGDNTFFYTLVIYRYQGNDYVYIFGASNDTLFAKIFSCTGDLIASQDGDNDCTGNCDLMFALIDPTGVGVEILGTAPCLFGDDVADCTDEACSLSFEEIRCSDWVQDEVAEFAGLCPNCNFDEESAIGCSYAVTLYEDPFALDLVSINYFDNTDSENLVSIVRYYTCEGTFICESNTFEGIQCPIELQSKFIFPPVVHHGVVLGSANCIDGSLDCGTTGGPGSTNNNITYSSSDECTVTELTLSGTFPSTCWSVSVQSFDVNGFTVDIVVQTNESNTSCSNPNPWTEIIDLGYLEAGDYTVNYTIDGESISLSDDDFTVDPGGDCQVSCPSIAFEDLLCLPWVQDAVTEIGPCTSTCTITISTFSANNFDYVVLNESCTGGPFGSNFNYLYNCEGLLLEACHLGEPFTCTTGDGSLYPELFFEQNDNGAGVTTNSLDCPQDVIDCAPEGAGEITPPENPDDCTVTEITVNGQHNNGCGFVESVDYEIVSGNIINVNINLGDTGEPFCSLAIVPWSETFPVGILSTGTYTINYFVNEGSSPIDTEIFTVSNADCPSGSPDTQIEVVGNPSTCDITEVTVSGTFPNGCWSVTDVDFIVASGNVTVYVTTVEETGIPCTQNLVPWSETIPIGFLTTGNYTFSVFENGTEGTPDFDFISLEECDSGSFYNQIYSTQFEFSTCEPATIVAAGVFLDDCHEITNTTYAVSGNNVDVFIITEIVLEVDEECMVDSVNWNKSFNLGFLPAQLYNLNLYLNGEAAAESNMGIYEEECLSISEDNLIYFAPDTVTECTPVAITVAGVFENPCLYVENSSYEIIGNNVNVYISSAQAAESFPDECNSNDTDWSRSFSIGSLDVDIYNLKFYLDGNLVAESVMPVSANPDCQVNSSDNSIIHFPEPITDCENLQLYISGNFSDLCSEITNVSYTLSGFTINVFVTAESTGETCPQAITPWSDALYIGFLPTGNYDANLIFNGDNVASDYFTVDFSDCEADIDPLVIIQDNASTTCETITVSAQGFFLNSCKSIGQGYFTISGNNVDLIYNTSQFPEDCPDDDLTIWNTADNPIPMNIGYLTSGMYNIRLFIDGDLVKTKGITVSDTPCNNACLADRGDYLCEDWVYEELENIVESSDCSGTLSVGNLGANEVLILNVSCGNNGLVSGTRTIYNCVGEIITSCSGFPGPICSSEQNSLFNQIQNTEVIWQSENGLPDCAPEPCILPNPLTSVTDIMENSFTLNINLTGFISYEWVVNEASTGIDYDFTSTTNSIPLSTEDTECDSYQWQVRVQCGNGVFSDWINGEPFSTLCPEEPCVTTANHILSETVGASSAILMHEPGTFAGYEWRYREPGAIWLPIPVASTTSGSYTAIGLSPCTSYEWQMRFLCDDDTWTEWTAERTFTTTCDEDCAITANQIASENADATTAVLTLNPGGYSFYRWRYRQVNASEWTDTPNTNVSQNQISGLSPCTTYEWQLQVQCDNGLWTEFFGPFTFTTDCPEECIVTAEYVLSQTTGTNSANLLIEPNGAFYSYQYRIAGNNLWTNLGETSSNIFFLTDLTDCTSYEWRMRLRCDENLWSEWSAEQPLVTDCIDTPEECNSTANVVLSENAGTNSVNLISSPDLFSAYQWRIRVAGSLDWFPFIETGMGNLQVDDLSSCQSYEWQSRYRCDNNLWGIWSNNQTFNTTGCPAEECTDSPFSDLNSDNITESSVDLSAWQGVYATYEWQLRKVSNDDWAEPTFTDNGNLSVSDLAECTSYEWRVRAQCDNDLWTNWSDAAQFTTTCAESCNNIDESLLSEDLSGINTVLSINSNDYSFYQWQYKLASNDDWIDIAYTSVPSVQIDDILECTSYQWRVRGRCSNTLWTVFTTVRTFDRDCVQPCDPFLTLNSTVNDDDDDVILSVVPDDFAFYYFEYRLSTVTDWTGNSGINSTLNLNDLPCGDYEWRAQVRCEDDPDAPVSIFSSLTFFSVECEEPCEPVLSLNSTVTDNSVLLSISPVGFFEYNIQWRMVGNPEWDEDFSPTSSITLESLECGDYQWRARVQCEDDVDAINSPFSMIENFTIIDCPQPCQPDLNITYDVNGNSVEASASPTNFLSYEWRFRVEGTTPWTTEEMTGSGILNLNDLAFCENYVGQIRVECTADSWSDWSDVSDFTTEGDCDNTPIFSFGSVTGTQGSIVDVPLRVENFIEYSGFQFYIDLNSVSALGTVVGIESTGILPGFSPDLSSVIWLDNSITLDDETIILNLEVLLHADAEECTSVEFDTSVNPPYTIFTDGGIQEVPAEVNAGQICAVAGQASVSGNFYIIKEDDITTEAINNGVQVYCSDGSNEMTPDNNNSFTFPALPLGIDYTFTPFKNDLHNNGLNITDVAAINSHILAQELLSSPYKMLAADVNNSDFISVADRLLVQAIVLPNQLEEFPNANSWKFIPADYSFINPSNPFLENHPNDITISDLEDDISNMDFIGMKTGDVYVSAVLEGLIAPTPHYFRVQNAAFNANEIITLEFTADDFTDLLGYQFDFEFNSEVLEFTEILPGVIGGFSPSNTFTGNASQGIISSLWLDELSTGKTYNASDILFSLKFTTLDAGSVAQNVSFGTSRDMQVALGFTEKLIALGFRNSTSTGNTAQNILQISAFSPNPFHEKGYLTITTSEFTEINFEIYNAAGQVVFIRQRELFEGNNTIVLQESDLPESGLFFYKVISKNGTQSGKFIHFK